MGETPETLPKVKGPGDHPPPRAGQWQGRYESYLQLGVEEGATEAVNTLEAAGVDDSWLLLLPRMAVLGTHRHSDLEGGEQKPLSPLSHSLGAPSPSLTHPQHDAQGRGTGFCLGGGGVLGLPLELDLCRHLLSFAQQRPNPPSSGNSTQLLRRRLSEVAE